MTVNVDLQASESEHPFAAGSARTGIEKAFASALAPFEDIVRHVDVGLRAEDGVAEPAHTFEVSVSLRNGEDPIVVSARRRVDAATALASQGGFLGQIVRSVAREVQEEHERESFRRGMSRDEGSSSAAADVADAVAALSDNVAETEVRAARPQEEGLGEVVGAESGRAA